jgi:heat shock protein HslJ
MRLWSPLIAVVLAAVIHCSVVMAQSFSDVSIQEQVLAGTQWRLVSFGRVGAETKLTAGAAVTLKFGTDDRMSGSGGCNSYGGGYRVQGTRIKFSQLFSTERACANSNANQQESRYLSALETANKFRLSLNRLLIYYDSDRSILDFVSDTPRRESDEVDDLDDPVSALNGYYRAIKARDYERAYLYWETPSQTLQEFSRGFSNTANVRLLVEPFPRIEGAAGSQYANVSTILITRRPNGVERAFAGCYVMKKSNLIPEGAQARQGWRIYKADIAMLPANARVTTVLSQTCR